MVRPRALPGVLLADEADAADGPCRGGRLSHARLWHLRRHPNSLCGALCLQVLPAGAAEEGQGLLLEDAQSDVLLAGKRGLGGGRGFGFFRKTN